MRHRVFSIFDTKAKAYLPPFFMPETGMALRMFTDALQSEKHVFCTHPEDYTLFEIGSFDDRTAKIEAFNAPELVSTGLSLLEASKPNGGAQLDLVIDEHGDT